MAKENNNTSEEVVICPVGRFFAQFERRCQDKSSNFYRHMNQSRVEFLKGIRSLIDERIDNLEHKQKEKTEKKATKIKVE